MRADKNKDMKIILKILLIILAIFMMFFQNDYVLAAERIELSSDKANIQKGEEIEITVSTPNTSIASLTLQIYFDMTRLEYVNKTENSNFSNNRVIYTWTDASNGTSDGTIEKFTFKALQDGTANIVVTGEFYDGSGNKVEISDGNMQVQIGKSEEVQISEEEIEAQNEGNGNNEDKSNDENQGQVSSDNTNLEIMRLNHVGISPEFQKDIKEYYFLADTYINELEVTAIPENRNATVKVSGNTNIKYGLNIISIEVESEDKTKKATYKIYVTKTGNKELANSNLENLAVREGMLFPSFDANITHYDIEVANNVSKLEILAIPQSMNAKVTIQGNDELKVGDNTITINVSAEDGITSKKYVITAHRRNEQEEVEEAEEQENQKEQLSAILANEEAEGEEAGKQNEKGQEEEVKEGMKIVDIITFILVGVVVIGFVIGFIVSKKAD